MDLPRLARLTDLFGLDTRSLALFRIGLGLLAMLDALDRLGNVSAHYTDAGVLPRGLVPLEDLRPSPLLIFDEPWLVAATLAVQVVAGGLLTFGRATRAATLVAWLCTIFVQARNPLVLYGSDILLRTMLLWGLFLPLDRRIALDAPKAAPRADLSVATAGYTLQIVVIYLATWRLKTGPAWHADGTAGWYALQAETFAKPLARALWPHTTLLEVATHATMALELWGPLLLFLPVFTARARVAVIAAMVAFHASLGLLMSIGWWPLTSIVCWLPLLPGALWDRLGWRVEDGPPDPAGPLRLPASMTVIAMGAMMLWWNGATLWPRSVRVKGTARQVALALRLDQRWDMYAPEPLTDDGWFVVDAKLEDGRRVDLLRDGAERDWHKPDDVARHHGSMRWQKLMRALWEKTWAAQRQPYARWWCTSWNAHTQVPATQVTLWYVLEETPAPGEPRTPPRTVRLSRTPCPGHETPEADGSEP